MPIVQYETQVSPEGYITLPPIPEYQSRKVVVSVAEHDPFDDDDWEPDLEAAQKFREIIKSMKFADDDLPTPTDEQLEKMYTLCRGCLKGMTEERFDQLRAAGRTNHGRQIMRHYKRVEITNHLSKGGLP